MILRFILVFVFVFIAGIVGCSSQSPKTSGTNPDPNITTTQKNVESRAKPKPLFLEGDKSALTDEDLAKLKDNTELLDLTLVGSYEQRKISAEGLNHLSALKKLEQLKVIECLAFNGEGMACVQNLKNLKRLVILRCGATNAQGIQCLKKLPNLIVLDLDSVGGDALSELNGMNSLKGLSLDNAHVTDDQLRQLKSLPSLNQLNLNNAKLTDRALENLSTLPSLTQLFLYKNKITDKGLAYLSGLTNLKSLTLDENQITSTGLKHLAKLKSLESLSLAGNPIEDDGITYLKMLPNLHRVDLTGTKVSNDAALQLQNAFPKAVVQGQSGIEVARLKNPTTRPKVEDLTNVPATFTLTADEFFQEFKANQRAAETKYRNQVVELQGTIKRFGERQQSPYCMMKAKDRFDTFFCHFAQPQPWADVAPDSQVTIKGRYPESDYLGAMLLHCVFLKKPPNQMPKFKSVELAKRFSHNPSSVLKKHKNQYVILSGKLLGKSFDTDAWATLELKGDGTTKVEAVVSPTEKELLVPLRVGEQVTLVGQCLDSFQLECVRIGYCLPIRMK